jgi:D-apionolactonase
MAEPTREIKLFGTDEPVVPPLLLVAGPLSAEFEDGNLRYIRLHGREMLRAISFIVRDRNWGTYRPRLSNLRVEQRDESFSLQYDAVAGDDAQSFRYGATLEGHADGRLVFEAQGEAATTFVTNRTGFVVLHPIEGVAGARCTIEHVDGRKVDGRFPELIDPVQPMMELRALTHEFAPGFQVTCRMEGDTFEMEDQRNWTDASYKTYVRPLALPWPYTIDKGERLQQRVSLSVHATPQATLVPRDERVVLSLQRAAFALPPLGLGLDPQDLQATLQVLAQVRSARPHHVIVSHDPRRGHDASTLVRAVEAARKMADEVWLEAVICDLERFDDEIDALGRSAEALGAPFTTVLVSPAPDLKCTLPGSPWPACPPLADVYRAARRAFPGVRLGGGMFSYFTELNRKRPPVEDIDLVTFTTSALVHAGDDRSASETLESLPYLSASVVALAGGKPYHVGPSAIGMRANPYGEAPLANPLNIRQAMNRSDPRQRGLFGAAWMVGYYARFARGGAAAITLGGAAGDFGLVHTPGADAKPWYDEHGGLYPAFHVFKGLSAMAGRSAVDVHSSAPRTVQAIGSVVDGELQVWVANLSATVQSIELGPTVSSSVAMLDERSFVAAARDPNAMEGWQQPCSSQSICLGPYAVARLSGHDF